MKQSDPHKSGAGIYWFQFMEGSPDRRIQIVRVRNNKESWEPPYYEVDFIDPPHPLNCSNTKPLDSIKGSWWGPIEKPE